jgi:UDP-N-acetylglucosamine diphosphorylase / glucose-1-phosphate thymidylyltransferase / UDP-N-acetylgalactosamine diphosphorylase / glucosamine-1-phosphate N-acetyltransferase / galactosamine-1-phosphate N-acetyltransferase
MTIVIPMAGLGSRFSEAGYTLPKPLIPVLDRPMYAWSAESLPLSDATRVIFILLATMPGIEDLTQDIRTRYAHLPIEIVVVPTLTSGQAATVLAAKHLFANHEPLLIHNADTAFRVSAGWHQRMNDVAADGAILVFRSDEERWSYARTDAIGDVVEVREKVVISPWATVGAYWVRSVQRYVELTEAAMSAQQTERGEYFVGPLYNDLIAKGGCVKLVEIDELLCFGTPQDYLATLAQLAA